MKSMKKKDNDYSSVQSQPSLWQEEKARRLRLSRMRVESSSTKTGDGPSRLIDRMINGSLA